MNIRVSPEELLRADFTLNILSIHVEVNVQDYTFVSYQIYQCKPIISRVYIYVFYRTFLKSRIVNFKVRIWPTSLRFYGGIDRDFLAVLMLVGRALGLSEFNFPTVGR